MTIIDDTIAALVAINKAVLPLEYKRHADVFVRWSSLEMTEIPISMVFNPTIERVEVLANQPEWTNTLTIGLVREQDDRGLGQKAMRVEAILILEAIDADPTLGNIVQHAIGSSIVLTEDDEATVAGAIVVTLKDFT